MGPKQGMFTWPFLYGDGAEQFGIRAAYAVRIGIGFEGRLLHKLDKIAKLVVSKRGQVSIIVQSGVLLQGFPEDF